MSDDGKKPFSTAFYDLFIRSSTTKEDLHMRGNEFLKVTAERIEHYTGWTT